MGTSFEAIVEGELRGGRVGELLEVVMSLNLGMRALTRNLGGDGAGQSACGAFVIHA